MENERPEYIIQVHRSWKYGPRARFWDICKWNEKYEYWEKITGGLAYTKWGMARAINKRLKKLKFGNQTEYFNIDGSDFKGVK